VTNCNCHDFCRCEGKYFALVRRCITSNNFNVLDDAEPLNFVHTFRELVRDYVAVDISSILFVCYVVAVADKGTTYIIEPVNMIEAE